MKQTTNGHDAISYIEGYQEGKKAGRREVIYFTYLFKKDITLNQMRATNLYQKQVKEWGLNETNTPT